jgi:hypothetical protein
MRYLHPYDVLSTLHRGKGIEQFLGGGICHGTATIRLVEIRPVPGGVEVWLHEPEDLGEAEFCDFYELIDVEGIPVRVEGTPEAALAIAHADFGALPNRWTHLGVAQEDYRDFVHAGRSLTWRDARE